MPKVYFNGKLPDATLLLDSTIPPPLHGLNPRTILGQQWWNRERKTAYRHNNNCCWACGIPAFKAKFYPRLEGHERYEIDYSIGLSTYLYTTALCHSCHNFIHIGRLTVLLSQKKCSKRKFFSIQAHGKSVLFRAKRRRRKPDYGKVVVPWNRWRLKIGRQLYKPLHASQAEWQEFYKRKK